MGTSTKESMEYKPLDHTKIPSKLIRSKLQIQKQGNITIISLFNMSIVELLCPSPLITQSTRTSSNKFKLDSVELDIFLATQLSNFRPLKSSNLQKLCSILLVEEDTKKRKENCKREKSQQQAVLPSMRCETRYSDHLIRMKSLYIEHKMIFWIVCNYRKVMLIIFLCLLYSCTQIQACVYIHQSNYKI